MPGPFHDFLLLPRTEASYSDYSRFIGDPRAISLEDDLIRYIADTLDWIPTRNPARDEPHRGLCFYGPTVIEAAGASAAVTIFDSWSAIFARGPERLKLKGGWTMIEDDPTNKGGEYQELNVDRDEVVRKLRQFADYARKVLETNGDYFILHLGV